MKPASAGFFMPGENMARKYESAVILTGDASGAVRAIELTDDHLRQLNARQERNRKTTSDWSDDWSRASNIVSGAIVGMGAAAAGVAALGIRQVQNTIATDRQAQALGLATGQLQAMQYAASSVGIEQDKMGDILKDVSDKIGDAYANGGGEALEVIQNLGLSTEELVKMDPADQLLTIGSALEKFGNRSERVTALEAIADDASILLKLLENNGAEMRRLMGQAYDLNVAIPPGDLESYREADRLIREATGATEGLFNTFVLGIASADLGPVNQSADELRSIVTDPAFHQAIADLAAGIASLIAGSARDLTQLHDELSSLGAGWTVALKEQFGIGDEIDVATSKARRLKNELSFLENLQQGNAIERGLKGYFSEDSLNEDIIAKRKEYNAQLDQSIQLMGGIAESITPASAAQASLSKTAIDVANSLGQQDVIVRGTTKSFAERQAAIEAEKAASKSAAQAAAQAEREHAQALKESAEAYKRLYGELNPAGKAQAEYQETLAQLRVELAEGTKTQLEYYAAVSQAAISYNDAVDAADPYAVSVKEVVEQYNAAYREGELLQHQLAAVRAAWAKDPDNADKYARAVKGISERMRELALESDPTAQEMARAWTEAADRIDETFADAFTGAFDSFDDFSSQLLDGFKRLLSELVYQATLKPIVVGFTGEVQGALGMGGGNGATLSSGISKVADNWSSIANYGSKAYNWATGGSAAASTGGLYGSAATGAGLYGSASTGLTAGGLYGNAATGGLQAGTAGMGSISSMIGPATLAYAANRGFEWLMQEVGFYDALGIDTSGTGAQIGSYLGPVGTILGSGLDSVFGSSREPFAKTWSGQQNADPKNFYRDYYAYTDLGTVGILDKQKMDPEPLVEWVAGIEKADNAIASMLDDSQLEAVRKRLAEPSKYKGTNLSKVTEQRYNQVIESIADSSSEWTGRLIERIGKIQADNIDEQANQLANALQLGRMIDEASGVVRRYAEDVASDLSLTLDESLQRIQSSINNYQLVTTASDRLGLQFDSLANGAIEAANGIVSLAGGIDAFSQQQQTYYASFFSDAEQFDRLTQDLTETFTDAGLALPATEKGVRDLVSGLDLMTEAGRQQNAVVMSNVDALKRYVDGMQQQRDAIEKQRDAIEKQRRAVEKEYRDSLGREPDTAGFDYWMDQIETGSVTLEDALSRIANSVEATYGDLNGALDFYSSGASDAIGSALKAYNGTVSTIDDIARTRQAQLDDEMQAIGSLSDLIDSLNRSDLAPASSWDAARRQYDDLYSQASAGDASVVQDFAGIAHDYLSLSESNASTALEYAQIYGQVTNGVSGLEEQYQDSVKEIGKGNSVADMQLREQQRARETLVDQLRAQIGMLDGINTWADLLASLPENMASAISGIVAEEGGRFGNSTLPDGIYTGTQGFDPADRALNDIYNQTLGRNADKAGLDYYKAELARGKSLSDIRADMEWSAAHGSHALGLDNVPFDGYRAELHSGEMILTRDVADTVRAGMQALSVPPPATFLMGSQNNAGNEALIQEIKGLRQQVSNMEARLQGINSATAQMNQREKRWDYDGMPETRDTTLEPIR